MVTRTAPADLHRVWEIAAGVVDPEIPVLTIFDLGILRGVRDEAGRIVVTITPTYSGCPAMAQIEEDLIAALASRGLTDVAIHLVHTPAWSTDWISAEGKRKLSEFGIAPPAPVTEVRCPRCDAGSPGMISQFGSTACKALMACSSCGEPFDLFKEF